MTRATHIAKVQADKNPVSVAALLGGAVAESVDGIDVEGINVVEEDGAVVVGFPSTVGAAVGYGAKLPSSTSTMVQFPPSGSNIA